MSVFEFLDNYWISILNVVIIFITLIMIFQTVGVNFSPVKDKRVKKIVTIESFDTEPNQDIIPFNYEHNHKILHNTCATHSARACKTANYCVLLDGETCVGGNKHGPTYLTKDGNKVDFNYYYYKYKCYGKCPQQND